MTNESGSLAALCLRLGRIGRVQIMPAAHFFCSWVWLVLLRRAAAYLAAPFRYCTI